MVILTSFPISSLTSPIFLRNSFWLSLIAFWTSATSALDSQSEAAILKALRELAKHHTSLVIAHRLSTITDADKILVLQQGEVAEAGTHQQLLAQQGLYAQLWAKQQEAKTKAE